MSAVISCIGLVKLSFQCIELFLVEPVYRKLLVANRAPSKRLFLTTNRMPFSLGGFLPPWMLCMQLTLRHERVVRDQSVRVDGCFVMGRRCSLERACDRRAPPAKKLEAQQFAAGRLKPKTPRRTVKLNRVCSWDARRRAVC